jgi:outer membrane lipoprotein-sorting protein
MKYIYTLFVLFFTANITNAQVDVKAKTILNAVTAKVKSLSSLKANFLINIAGAKGKVNQTKRGTVSMKGAKYVVSISGQEIYCDSKTIWTYMKESNEVNVNTVDPNESTFTPSKLFTNFYDKEYTSKYMGEKKEGAITNSIIELYPTNKSKSYSKVELKINKATNIISGGRVFEKNGNVYSYSISGFTANAPLVDNVFVFDAKKHPGVEVVDLR